MIPAAVNHVYRFGEFTVDAEQKVLLREGKPLALTPKVFDTLLILVENSGRIVEKEELMRRLWPDTFVEEANLTFNIQQLRKALGDKARHPSFIETVARRGYRFIAPVSTDEQLPNIQAGNNVANALSPESSAAAIDYEAIQTHGGASTDPPRPTHRRWLASLGIVVVLTVALGSWLLWKRSPPRAPASSEKVMLAVLPFQNLMEDAGQDYFSDGMTEEMITQLGNLDPDHLGVIARTSAMHYKNSHEPLDQIGRELQVQYVLEGSVRRESDRVRITTQLIQMKDLTHVWARQYDRELTHLLSLQGEVAQEVADEVHLTLNDHTRRESSSSASSAPINYEAYDLYLKGQYFWNKRTARDFQQAIDCFQQAIAKDPSSARAYAGLASSYALIGSYSGDPQAEFKRKARAAALRALELDEGLPEAHTALALIVQNYDWDWQAAEKEFRRAIELNPNYATAHHLYAEHLARRGRFDEALRENAHARQLDPLSLIIAADKGVILYFSRQYDSAIEQFRYVLDMEPNFPRAGMIMAAYIQKGMFTEARASVEKQSPSDDNPWYWAWQAYIYGRSGRPAQAQRALEKLLQLNRRHQVDGAALVWAYIGIGNKDEALAWLEQAYLQHSNLLTTLKVEPAFDPLRSDRRFQQVLQRVGLAQ